MYISYPVRSWLYLIFLIPSIFCSIFVLYHFLVDRALRTAGHNHAIIVIVFFNLFYEVTDVAWLIHYYRTGSPLSSTRSFCLTWIFIDYAIFLLTSYLIVWIAIERHILIFHRNWVSTQRKRFLVHYVPMIIVFIYSFAFYIYVFLVESCDEVLDYTKSRCGYPACVYRYPIIAMWDSIVNSILPIFIVIIFSIALLVRVLYQRQRARRQFRWKNYRKLVVQLMPISAIYFVIYFPPMLLYTAYTCGLSATVGADFYSFTIYLFYYGIFLIPFASSVSIPKLKNKCQNIILFWHRPRPDIGPEIILMNRLRGRQIAAVSPIE